MELPTQDSLRPTGTADAATDGRPTLLLAAVGLNIMLSVAALAIEGPVPSAVVYPVVLGVGLHRLLRRGRSSAVLFLAAAAVFLLVHAPFLSAAASADCVHPFDSSRSCNKAFWVAWLGVAPVALALTSGAHWLGQRRLRDGA
jgi:hypothetical protein